MCKECVDSVRDPNGPTTVRVIQEGRGTDETLEFEGGYVAVGMTVDPEDDAVMTGGLVNGNAVGIMNIMGYLLHNVMEIHGVALPQAIGAMLQAAASCRDGEIVQREVRGEDNEPIVDSAVSTMMHRLLGSGEVGEA